MLDEALSAKAREFGYTFGATVNDSKVGGSYHLAYGKILAAANDLFDAVAARGGLTQQDCNEATLTAYESWKFRRTDDHADLDDSAQKLCAMVATLSEALLQQAANPSAKAPLERLLEETMADFFAQLPGPGQ